MSVYRGLNGFELTLSFNAQDSDTAHFGSRWRDSFDRRVAAIGSNVVAYRPDGKALQFVPNGGAWVGDADISDRLIEQQNPPGTTTGWQLQVAKGDELETYDASGKLLTIRSRSGLGQQLFYSDGSGGANGGFILDSNGLPTASPLPAGVLVRASDNFGRTLVFGYDAKLRIVKLTDPAGGVYRFVYDANGNLASIAFPDGASRSYQYDEQVNTGGAILPNALTGIIDENGARFATFQYNAQERVVSTEHSGALHYAFSYASGATTVSDPLGTARTYGFQVNLAAFKNTGITGPACPSCGPASQSFDANGNAASRTDWNGHVTNYSYDLSRNLETSRTEAFGTAQARTISTQWHPNFRLPARVAEPLRITSYAYNGDGVSCGVMADGSTLVPGVLCTKTIQATSDATGASGFGASPVGTPRIWRYTYNPNGSVLTADGPRTDVADVTSYAYYANNDADPGKRGNLASVTNALGFTTSILSYNAHGQPLTIVDPNGLTTTLGYDARQRLTSRNVGGETTIYGYDNVGQLIRVTLPDNSFLSYGYDAAHRLTSISDNLGNSITYTLDPMGNRTREDVRDPGGSLAQTRSRVYDPLNRLFQDIGAQNQTTQYAYDNQGNLTSIDGPLSGAVDVTTNGYDALNRLVRVTDPGNGVTQYGYNGLDQLSSVTDPRNLVTAYGYDGLGNLNSQVSPDTGNTVNTYDAAGNLATQTDAKGQITRYAYDALNRVTSITFDDGSAQNYGYDQGSNGLGRLTFFAETNPQNQITILQDYAYDSHGRTITENRTLSGVTYAMRYRYDAAGRLFGLTYPSGRTVDYSFDALGRINQVSTTPASGATQVVASNVAYQPFGGVKSWTLGNGQTYSRGYDTDGRIASYGTGAQVFSLGYDPAGRIFSITDSASSGNPAAYGYDNLDRLISATTPTGSFGYTYDAVGNRLTKTTGAGTDTYAYSATSNRLDSISGTSSRSFTFDANGSTLRDGVKLYAYDARGRMLQSVNEPGLATAYQVNALGQRVRKTNSTDDRVFLYDMRGHLIAETSPGGTPLREYLYLADIPIAVIQ